MSNEDKKTKTDKAEVYKLGDDLIAVVRELVQLSLLTGTNIVDHLRAVRTELVENSIVPTEDYINEYNAYIEELQKQAEELQAKMQQQEATDDTVH